VQSHPCQVPLDHQDIGGGRQQAAKRILGPVGSSTPTTKVTELYAECPRPPKDPICETLQS
jgi:hypothetical protein